MEAAQILQTLDNYAEEYEFPSLDNYNFDLAHTRLSVFRDESNWLIVFQIVGVNLNQDICNYLYGYGNVLEEKRLFIGLDEIISLPNEEEWFDEEDRFIFDPFHLKLMVNGETLNVKPKKEDYIQLGIPIEPFNPTKLVRYLSSEYKEKLLLDANELLKEFQVSNSLTLFYQTDEWEHPDEPDEEKPSENKFFQSLAKAIELDDINLIQMNKPNTHWSFWTVNDFENQDGE